MKKILSVVDKKVRVRLYLIVIMSFLTVILESLSIISIFPLIKILIDPEFLSSKSFF